MRRFLREHKYDVLVVLLLVVWVVVGFAIRSSSEKPSTNTVCIDGFCISKDDFPITVHYERREDLPAYLKKCKANTILVEKGGRLICPTFDLSE